MYAPAQSLQVSIMVHHPSTMHSDVLAQEMSLQISMLVTVELALLRDPAPIRIPEIVADRLSEDLIDTGPLLE
jgi:hypothetical protein